MKTHLTITAAALALTVTTARASVIDFNDSPDNVYWISTVTSDGYVATGDDQEYGGTPLGTAVAIDGEGPSNGTIVVTVHGPSRSKAAVYSVSLPSISPVEIRSGPMMCRC
jgi:hypothetical protein